ncbi:MAG: Asp-tRNA(Asn)/Glu-tRNA(Gln) amidotransferase subunit GatB, partial [Patescibacteria group bacterium]|nr:Asp-tRNA(Asn)/Glu-tRNA(Gln) amidotransferase subunit GatB [Patescibacteria group bacterium]
IGGQWLAKIKAGLIELPMEKKKRFKTEYNFDETTAEILVSDKNLADYAEKVISELRAWIDSAGDDWARQKNKLAKITANWLIGELFKYLNENKKAIIDIKITPENFAEFIALVHKGKINSSAAQKIMQTMYEKGGDPTDIMADLGLEQIDDSAELEKIIKAVIEKNPKQVGQYSQGKTNVLQFFVGQVMSVTKGKANPKIVIELLKKLLTS